MATSIIGLGDARGYLDDGLDSYFCIIGKFPTVSGSWVRIFLAAISKLVLTTRFGLGTLGSYKGGCNKLKSCLLQRNPHASVPLALVGEDFFAHGAHTNS